MLRLKLQYYGHMIQRADSLENTLMLLGKVEGRRKRGQQSGHEFEQALGDGGVLQSMGMLTVRYYRTTEQQQTACLMVHICKLAELEFDTAVSEFWMSTLEKRDKYSSINLILNFHLVIQPLTVNA